MTQIINEPVFLSLSEEKQVKVMCIYHINLTFLENNLDPITTRDFDNLYDKPVPELQQLAGAVTARFHRAKYPDFE
jgi:hypothetical protein